VGQREHACQCRSNPCLGPRALRSSRRFAGRLTARGCVTVDAGAAAALRQGKSLLAAGATRIDGQFARGDVIEIADIEGARIARGLSEYDAADAARIAGTRSGAHASLLGYAPRAALVHRDHLVLL